jgi:acyl carrier protein
MTREQIIERLRTTMRTSTQEAVNWDTVTAETTIAELGFDSLSILDLLYDVQQEFGIDFEPQELVDIGTVGDLADFVLEEMQA